MAKSIIMIAIAIGRWNLLARTAVILAATMEVLMGWLSRLFETKHNANVENSATSFARPMDVVNNSKLSKTEKVEALDAWEQDARQLMTASNEGMPGPKEGVDPHDHHRMDRVLQAKETIGKKPVHKQAH